MAQSDTETTSISSSRKTWPVHLKDHVNVYARILYDVEGNILVDRTGRLINVFRSNMEESMDQGWLKVYRNSTMGGVCYRYFVTSREQFITFVDDRDNGTYTGPNVFYHVYVDDDTDKSLPEFKRLFRESREV